MKRSSAKCNHGISLQCGAMCVKTGLCCAVALETAMPLRDDPELINNAP